MMGSAATAARAADNAAFRRAKQEIALERAKWKIDAAKLKLDAKLDRSRAKTGVIDVKGSVLAQRADTESKQLLAPVASDAEVAAVDAQSRATIFRALPWIIGGVVVVGAVVFLRKKKGGS